MYEHAAVDGLQVGAKRNNVVRLGYRHEEDRQSLDGSQANLVIAVIEAFHYHWKDNIIIMLILERSGLSYKMGYNKYDSRVAKHRTTATIHC